MKWKLFSYFLVNRFNGDLFIDIYILFVKCTNCLRKSIILKYIVKMYINLQTHQQSICRRHHAYETPFSLQSRKMQSFKMSLTLFVKASGLAVYPNKSQVYFLNTAPVTQRNIMGIVGFQRGMIPSKYLGVPLGMGKVKKASWQELLDKMKERLSSWVLCLLNVFSRLILVKALLGLLCSTVRFSRNLGTFFLLSIY